MRAFQSHILLVEDDPRVRELIQEILEQDGFCVTTADTAADALYLIRPGKFVLIIADINLPGGKDGLTLVRQARVCDPHIKALFISGSHEPAICDPETDEFVAKPFVLGELLGCVFKVLNGNQPNPRLTIVKD